MTFVRTTAAAQLTLPLVPDRFLPEVERTRNDALVKADGMNHKRDRDLDLGQHRIILQAPDGSRRYLLMSNAGVLSTSAAI